MYDYFGVIQSQIKQMIENRLVKQSGRVESFVGISVGNSDCFVFATLQ